MPRQVYVNIGSNQGDRYANIEQAVALIAKLADGGEVLRSTMIETDPWGFQSENRFVNIGVVFRSSISAQELLTRLQEIEHSISPGAHRDTDGNYIDREIDIDIIAVEDVEIDLPELTLPHPRMKQRDFVMEPLRELSASAAWLKRYL